MTPIDERFESEIDRGESAAHKEVGQLVVRLLWEQEIASSSLAFLRTRLLVGHDTRGGEENPSNHSRGITNQATGDPCQKERICAQM